jgi:hypothetical protein
VNGISERGLAVEFEMGMNARGKDVAFGHGSHVGVELPADGIFGASTLRNVPTDTASETGFMTGGHEGAESEPLANRFPMKGKQALHEHEGCGFDSMHAPAGSVQNEVVDGLIDRFTGGKLLEIAGRCCFIHGLRRIEVNDFTFGKAEVAEVAIVAIERKDGGMEFGCC